MSALLAPRTFFGAALAAALTVGCGPVGGSAGELGNGNFYYRCVAPGDVVMSASICMNSASVIRLAT